MNGAAGTACSPKPRTASPPPMLLPRLRRNYRQLLHAYDEVEDLLAAPEDLLYASVPKASGWTPAQHLHHVTAINEQVFDWLLRTARSGEAAPEVEGRLSAAGRVLLTVGRLPRGRARSPQRFTPPDQVSRQVLEERARRTHAQLRELEAHLEALRRSDARLPHPVFGALTAPQWVRFAGVHSRHHLLIVRDIVREHRR